MSDALALKKARTLVRNDSDMQLLEATVAEYRVIGRRLLKKALNQFQAGGWDVAGREGDVFIYCLDGTDDAAIALQYRALQYALVTLLGHYLNVHDCLTEKIYQAGACPNFATWTEWRLVTEDIVRAVQWSEKLHEFASRCSATG